MTEPPQDPHDAGSDRDAPALSFRQVVSSTLAAAFGVQSSRNRERDFKRGRMLPFIVAGVVFTLLFVLGVVAVVHLVLSRAA